VHQAVLVSGVARRRTRQEFGFFAVIQRIVLALNPFRTHTRTQPYGTRSRRLHQSLRQALESTWLASTTVKPQQSLRDVERGSNVIDRKTIIVKSIVIEDWFDHPGSNRVGVRVPANA